MNNVCFGWTHVRIRLTIINVDSILKLERWLMDHVLPWQVDIIDPALDSVRSSKT